MLHSLGLLDDLLKAVPFIQLIHMIFLFMDKSKYQLTCMEFNNEWTNLERLIELVFPEFWRSITAHIRAQAVLGSVVDLLHQSKHFHWHLGGTIS